MTPEQAIKYMILALTAKWQEKELSSTLTGDEIDDLYEQLVEENSHWDAKYEIRNGEIETNIESEYSRHYESKSVAAKMSDGRWVGWTYWYGGGKHAEPEAVEWMGDAYFLDCIEEEKVVTVRTFTKLMDTKYKIGDKVTFFNIFPHVHQVGTVKKIRNTMYYIEVFIEKDGCCSTYEIPEKNIISCEQPTTAH